MSYSEPSPDSASRPHLRLIRDEEAPPYDGDPPPVQRGRVVIVPADVGETILGSLGTGPFGVYWHLAKRANADAQCWPSLDDIAEACMVTRKHITRLLDQLERDGWVLRERRNNRFGMAASTLYTLPHLMKDTGERTAVTSSGHDLDMTPSKMSHEQDTNNTQRDNVTPPLIPPKPKTAKRDRAEGFAEWYALYPRKAAPADAERSWRRLSPDEQKQALASLEQWVDVGAFSPEPDFIPYPATWLNKGHWRTEPTPRRAAAPRASPNGAYVNPITKWRLDREGTQEEPEPQSAIEAMFYVREPQS